MLVEILFSAAGILSAGGAWRYRHKIAARITPSVFKLKGSDIDKPTAVLAEMVVLDMLKLECSIRDGVGYGSRTVFVKTPGKYDFTGRIHDGEINGGDLTIGGLAFEATTPEFKLVAAAVNKKVLPLYKRKQDQEAEQKRQDRALEILGGWVGGREEKPAPTRDAENPFLVNEKLESVRALRAKALMNSMKEWAQL